MDDSKELDNVIDLAKAIGDNWGKLSTRAQWHGYNVMQYKELSKMNNLILNHSVKIDSVDYGFVNVKGQGE